MPKSKSASKKTGAKKPAAKKPEPKVEETVVEKVEEAVVETPVVEEVEEEVVKENVDMVALKTELKAEILEELDIAALIKDAMPKPAAYKAERLKAQVSDVVDGTEFRLEPVPGAPESTDLVCDLFNGCNVKLVLADTKEAGQFLFNFNNKWLAHAKLVPMD